MSYGRIDGLVGQNAIDSPVFLFLPTLGAVEKAIPDVANAEAPRTSESIAELMGKTSIKRKRP